jgi:hypothetical protein
MIVTFLRKYLSILMACLGSTSAGTTTYGQATEIEKSFARYNEYNLQEKVYIHTDRSFYLCGEVLWLKAYVTNAADNHPLSLSKVVYVEVLNKEHQPVLQAKIASRQGSGNGSFFLPFSLASGNYQLRAYTNWMKNFSPNHYFQKNISIINTSRNLDPSAVDEAVSYHAAFFPEGGNLVNGLESEIAFKVNNNKLNGVNCEGVIIDQFNDTIVHIKTLHAGIGHFFLKPETGKDYTAVIGCKDGSIVKESLPKAFDEGYVMHVGGAGRDDVKISITSQGLKGNDPGEIYLIIQNGGKIDFAKSQRIENGSAVLIINKNILQDGVSQITIFDFDKHPQCERLYFKRPKNKMLVNAGTDKTRYQLRSRVSVDVATTDPSGNALPADLSVSVFRLDSLHQPDKENIFSYLWLSSSLRGSIEDPGYYFSNENEEINEALDNLLLAQGWRRFNWEKALQNKTPSFKNIPEYSGHIITGRITNADTKKPVSDVLVYLSVPGRRVQLKGCISDSSGLVHFDMKDFIGSSQIVVQTNNGDDSTYRFEIFSPFSEEFTHDELPSCYVPQGNKDYLQTLNFHMQVENGYHQKDLQKLQDPLIDSLPFYFKPDKTYLLDNYTRFTTMEEVMREYVDEIDVRRKGKDFRFLSLNKPVVDLQGKQFVELLFQKNPLVLLDGVPVFDINKIIAYDPLKVQKLEVVASKYYWGPITAYGIASFTTYKANLEGYTLDPNDLVLDYDGLQQQRTFYSPDYSTNEQLQSPLPDFRDVLYWSPNIATDEKGKGLFSFYTGDVPGNYFVMLQGITPGGKAGSTSFILHVEK